MIPSLGDSISKILTIHWHINLTSKSILQTSKSNFCDISSKMSILP